MYNIRTYFLYLGMSTVTLGDVFGKEAGDRLSIFS